MNENIKILRECHRLLKIFEEAEKNYELAESQHLRILLFKKMEEAEKNYEAAKKKFAGGME